MKQIRSYFIQSKKERVSAGWLVGLALLAAATPFIYAIVFNKEITEPAYVNTIADLNLQTPADTSEFAAAPYEHRYNRTNSDTRSFNNNRSTPSKNESENLQAALFSFDPNNVSESQLVSLGLKPSTAKNFIKYRNAGAKFYKAEDIRRIWGLSPQLAERLIPHVTIEKPAENNASSYANTTAPREAYTPRPRVISNVSLNTTDTTALIALPGIGSKLANRILDFRNKLGGSHSVEQVAEVYGLKDSVFQSIKQYLQVDGEVRKININTATQEELKNHPYIRFNFAKVIVAYREQHGKYADAAALKKILVIPEDAINKMAPYLSFE